MNHSEKSPWSLESIGKRNVLNKDVAKANFELGIICLMSLRNKLCDSEVRVLDSNSSLSHESFRVIMAHSLPLRLIYLRGLSYRENKMGGDIMHVGVPNWGRKGRL